MFVTEPSRAGLVTRPLTPGCTVVGMRCKGAGRGGEPRPRPDYFGVARGQVCPRRRGRCPTCDRGPISSGASVFVMSTKSSTSAPSAALSASARSARKQPRLSASRLSMSLSRTMGRTSASIDSFGFSRMMGIEARKPPACDRWLLLNSGRGYGLECSVILSPLSSLFKPASDSPQRVFLPPRSQACSRLQQRERQPHPPKRVETAARRHASTSTARLGPPAATNAGRTPGSVQRRRHNMPSRVLS